MGQLAGMLSRFSSRPAGVAALGLGPAPGFREAPARYLAAMALLAVVYFAVARASLFLALPGTNASPVWPPSGIAFAVLTVFGARLWPGIWLGAFAANLVAFRAGHGELTAGMFAASAGIGLGNSAEALLTVAVARRWFGGIRLSDAARGMEFLFALLLGCALAAGVGVACQGLAGIAPWSMAGTIARTWWLGDAAGILVLAPALVILADLPRKRPSWREAAEGAAYLLALTGLAYAVFWHAGGDRGVYVRSYAIIPLLILARFRGRAVAAYTGMFSVACVAVLGTIRGVGPYAGDPVQDQLLLLQLFAGVAALSLGFLGATIADRDASAEALAQANASLERTVADRTAESEREKEKALRFAEEAGRANEELTRANRELAAGEARFRQLSDAGFEGLVIHERGIVRLSNLAACEMFGYGPEEFIGKTVAELCAPEALQAAVENMRNESGQPVVIMYMRKSGERFPGEARGKPIEYQGRPMRVVAIRDVTERAKAEELRTHAMEALQSANRAKSEFLATMSHEIRTPLNGIIGMGYALEATRMDAEQARYVGILKECGEALLEQVNGILDLAKIESGRMQLESAGFDLGAAVSAALAPFAEQAARKGLAWSADTGSLAGVRAEGDAKRLRQILANLAGNALKFTASGSIKVTARIETKGKLMAFTFRIADTGIGMDAAVQARLFTPFMQADASMSRKFGGSGLGLAICRQLVELMGGTISVESRPGEGSTFTVKCDFRADPAGIAERGGPVAPSAAAAVPAQGPRVLVVEDDPVNQEVARIFLAKRARALVVVSSGPEAVARAASGSFDLILMDCQLPGMDGFETTAAIRKGEAAGGNRARIVAMTANAVAGDRERCLAAGMDDYLSKPLDPAQVAAMLERAGAGA